MQKGRLELQVEAAVNHIATDLSVPLETALSVPPLENRPEVEDALFKINRRIANLGTINPDAAEEYDALKVRYDYLAAQLEDLDRARRSLAKINRVIDARMKEDFVRTYEAVDRNFQEIFSILFPGGSANLSLVDPDDVENTGVEVNAQPKGKRIAKMMLLSGGEKSLTALALLFAVYRIRSTPFYILDEVEAALDDTNLRRLAAYPAHHDHPPAPYHGNGRRALRRVHARRWRHQGHQPEARPGLKARGVGVSGHLGDNCIEKPQGLGACIDFVASTATDLGNDAVGG